MTTTYTRLSVGFLLRISTSNHTMAWLISNKMSIVLMHDDAWKTTETHPPRSSQPSSSPAWLDFIVFNLFLALPSQLHCWQWIAMLCSVKCLLANAISSKKWEYRKRKCVALLFAISPLSKWCSRLRLKPNPNSSSFPNISRLKASYVMLPEILLFQWYWWKFHGKQRGQTG